MEIRKLDVGAGCKKEGWITCDVRPGCDYICSAVEVHTLGKFDEILMNMVLEHLRPWEIRTALSSCYEALNNGGFLDVAVPDFEDIIALYKSSQKREAFRRLFGGSLTEGGPDDCPEQEHRWAFDEKTLWYGLNDAGFKNVKNMNAPRGILWMRGYK